MRWLVVLLLVHVSIYLGCAGITKTATYSESKFREVKEWTAKCMDVPVDSFLVHIPKPETGTKNIKCNNRDTKDCYYSATKTCVFPEFTTEGNIKHCFVHAIADQVFGLGDDQKHTCTIGANNCYLKCSGIMIH